MKPTRSYAPKGNPRLPDPLPEMTLRGNRNSGGVLEVSVDSESLDVDLPPTRWAVLADLFLGAIRASHWTDAYVASKKLAVHLENFEVSDTPTENTVYKIVSELRSQLAESGIRELTDLADMPPKKWSMELIHTRNKSGYRITIPPQLLTVYIDKVVYSLATPHPPEPDETDEPEDDGKILPR